MGDVGVGVHPVQRMSTRTHYRQPLPDGATRVYVSDWTGFPPGPGDCVINKRTGEMMRVVAIGPGWMDVVRAVRPQPWWPAWAWLLVALAGTVLLDAARSPLVSLAAVAVVLLGMAKTIIGTRRWLNERTDW